MKGLNLKNLIFAALLGLAAGAAAWAFPMALLIMPGFLACTGAAWGMGALAAALSSSAASVLWVYGPGLEALSLMLTFLPQSLIIAVYLAGKKPYRHAVGLCAAVSGLGLYADTCLPSLLRGGGPFDYFAEYLDAFGDALIKNISAMGLADGDIAGVSRFIAEMKLMAPNITMLVITSMGMGSGLICVLTARRLLSRRGVRLKPMAPFSRWQLSSTFTRGSIVLIIGAVITMYSGVRNATAVGTAVACIVVGAYALMGVCFMAFTAKLKLNGRGMMVLSAVALIILLPYSIYGIAVIGAADRLLRLRRKYLERKG